MGGGKVFSLSAGNLFFVVSKATPHETIFVTFPLLFHISDSVKAFCDSGMVLIRQRSGPLELTQTVIKTIRVCAVSPQRDRIILEMVNCVPAQTYATTLLPMTHRVSPPNSPPVYFNLCMLHAATGTQHRCHC